MPKLAILVNDVAALKSEQSTTRFIECALQAGHRVVVADVLSVSVHPGQAVHVRGVDFDPELVSARKSQPATRAAIVQATRRRRQTVARLDDMDLVLVRTSPGRDIARAWAHRLTLQALQMAVARGVPVVNDPVALQRASSKLYTTELPEGLAPPTLVTHSAAAAREFIAELGTPAVLKPLVGSGGRDVVFVDGPDASNLDQLCALLGRTGYIVVQAFMPEAADGDCRVITLDGAVLEIDGTPAVVKRVPKDGEFRGNVALGARAVAHTLTPTQRANADRVATIVADDGIRLAGLDLVGERVVEVNVFSAGGIIDAEQFYERPYTKAILSTLLAPAGTVGGDTA